MTTGSPPKQVVILTSGGGGDVAPYTGLGVRLRAAGYHVAIATHEPFAGQVEACGLEHRPLPGDPQQVLHRVEQPSGRAARLRDLERYNSQLAAGLVSAARKGADVLLLATTTVQLGSIVAEALDLPSMGVCLQPTEPTGDFPSVLMPTSLGRWGNRVSNHVVGGVLDALLAKVARRLRADLDLPLRSLGALGRRRRRDCWPIRFGFSPTVVARPSDWRPGVEVDGYWWPEQPASWQPPAALTAFLEAGPPPVCVGFGSLGGEGGRLGELVLQALRQARLRGVIQAGWGGLEARGDDVIAIGEAPHDWLFPRMAAVVHAAGAGVTAAGLRAGVPAVPVPVALDQPFWGRRLVALGASPDSIPFGKLSVERLAASLRAAVTQPGYAERAAAAGARIREEDGAGLTVEAVRRLAGAPTYSEKPMMAPSSPEGSRP